jgi:hypothetical protein
VKRNTFVFNGINVWTRWQAIVSKLVILLSSVSFSLCQAQTKPTTICPTTSSTNTDCGFIIAIGPGGTIAGAPVANAQPYDVGGNGTLVGVVNNSGKTFTGSFTITAQAFGLGVFAFDGDGICVYIGPNGIQPNPMGTYCLANDVSGVDPGDYAGPKVSFSNINSASTIYDTGTVAITGLANGATTFFSLNGPPSGIQASGGLLITVPLTATGTNLGAINLGGTISGTISVTGGAPPYTYAVIGSVPSGITVNGGTISGLATQTGTFCVSFRVTDSTDATATASVSYSVVHPSAPPACWRGQRRAMPLRRFRSQPKPSPPDFPP